MFFDKKLYFVVDSEETASVEPRPPPLESLYPTAIEPIMPRTFSPPCSMSCPSSNASSIGKQIISQNNSKF